MDFKDYQALALRTANQLESAQDQLANFGLGLSGEAGETVNNIKKLLYHHKDYDEMKAKIIDELGDVLRYAAALCSTLNVSMEDVAAQNIEKLKARFPDSFDTARTPD